MLSTLALLALAFATLPPVQQGELVGTVRNANGEAVEQAQVKLVPAIDPKKAVGAHVEGKTGVYRMEVEPGSWVVLVSASGYQTQTKTFLCEAGKTTLYDVVLSESQVNGLTFLRNIPASLWAIVVSLLLTYLLYRLNQPRLHFEIEPREPYVHQFSRQFPSGAGPQGVVDIHFTRIKVINRGPKNEAEDVDVSVTQVWKKPVGKPTDESKLRRFVPGNLRWSNTWDIGQPGFHNRFDMESVLVKKRISARKGYRLCDLGFIVDPKRLNYFCEITGLRKEESEWHSGGNEDLGDVVFLLALDRIRLLPPRCLGPGEYCVELLCDARAVRPRKFYIALTVPNEYPTRKPSNEPGDFDVRRVKGKPKGCDGWEQL